MKDKEMVIFENWQQNILKEYDLVPSYLLNIEIERVLLRLKTKYVPIIASLKQEYDNNFESINVGQGLSTQSDLVIKMKELQFNFLMELNDEFKNIKEFEFRRDLLGISIRTAMKLKLKGKNNFSFSNNDLGRIEINFN